MDISVRFAVMLLVVPILVIIAARKPLTGVYSTMVMYFFRPAVWTAPDWWQPVFWISMATIAGWAVRAKEIRITPTIIVSCILVLAMIVTSFGAWRSSAASFDATVVVIKLITVLFLIVQLLRQPRDFWIFLWVMVFANGWTLKSVCVITAVGGDASRANVAAAQGGGSNYLAMTFVMAVPLLFYRYLHGKRWEKRAVMVLAPLHLFAIVGTGSRGGFLTLLCVFMFLMVRSNRKLMGFLVTVVSVAFFFAVMPEAKLERFKTTFEDEQGRGFAAQSRVLLWRAAWTMFKQSPITGVGHDNFQILSPRYVGFFAGDTPIPYSEENDGRKGFTGFVAHSTWYQSLADGGLLCSIPFFGLFIMSFYTLYRIRRLKLAAEDDHEVQVLSQAMEGTMWAFIIASSFGSHFKIDPLWWLFGAISALGLMADQMAARIRAARQQEMLRERAKKWGVEQQPAGV